MTGCSRKINDDLDLSEDILSQPDRLSEGEDRMPVIIRRANPMDAAVIANLANLLCQHEGLGDTVFTEEQVLRDGFGDRPSFEVLIAELADSAVGYALFTEGYNTDIAARAVWLEDLFVEDAARGQGIGRKLLAAVARTAVERGARSVWWGVRSSNRQARRFYAGLGAKDDDARILELNDAALTAIAKEADAGL